MNSLQIILLIITTLSGIPLGLLISKYTREEIKKGKLELKILIAVSMVCFLISLFLANALLMTVSGFVFLLTLTSIRKV